MKYNEVIYRFGLILVVPLFILMFPCAFIQLKLSVQWFNDTENIGILLMSLVSGGTGLLFGAMSFHFLSPKWNVECGVPSRKSNNI